MLFRAVFELLGPQKLREFYSSSEKEGYFVNKGFEKACFRSIYF